MFARIGRTGISKSVKSENKLFSLSSFSKICQSCQVKSASSEPYFTAVSNGTSVKFFPFGTIESKEIVCSKSFASVSFSKENELLSGCKSQEATIVS